MRNRRRDAKHPLVICTLGSWAVFSASQLWFGPAGSKVVSGMNGASQHVFSGLLLASSVACLISAFLKREPRGANFERFGMFGCAVALGYYSFDLPSAIESWNTSAALALAGGALGCVLRAGLVWRMIRHRETW